MSKLHWAIDYFIQKNGTIFSYGWAFNEEKKIEKLSLYLPTGQSGSILNIDYGKSREDISSYFSGQEYAKQSGYVIYGSFGPGVELKNLQLQCIYTDGVAELVSIPDGFIHSEEENGKLNSKKLMLKQFVVLLKRAFMIAKSGNFSLLFDKIKRYKNKIPRESLNSAKDIVSILESSEREKVVFFIDHDLGGGANHYRNQLIDEKLKSGKSVIVLSFDISSLSYKLIIRGVRGEFNFKISGYQFIYELLNFIKIIEIIYNTGVSFVRPEEIPSFLISLKIKTSATLITLAHDLFPLCPSHFLINSEGQYCDLPDPVVCSSCLRNNTFGFTTLFESKDIEKWRDQWGGLMIASDKIVTFSENTLNLYKRVYPEIQSENTLVSPHSVTYLPKKVEIKQKQHLRIGVVGQIGYHKGALFVKQLAEEIKIKNLPIEIIIVGGIEMSCPPNVVKQTGPYKHNELSDLLEEHGVNIVLFPSIWPETFSYVVQEMMELGYPVASFDLGAPAERLRTYRDGLVLSSMSAEIVLQELLEFHRKIYSIK
ncbi:glycosyltransferase [Rahnella selenatireducens]|uniref:glycosyltransferase n=1 Tax=Rahnella selenatireducens TaxID=3389797 RepID=UPI003968FFB3